VTETVAVSATTAMHELLAASLEAWNVDGTVTIDPDGALLLTRTAVPSEPLRIARAPAGLPFRWQVTYLGRTRSVSSVAGVLRTVRAVVDPDHDGMQARVGSPPAA
jgi:hypothetical protein